MTGTQQDEPERGPGRWRLRFPISLHLPIWFDRGSRAVPGEARLLEPKDTEELLRGWLLHAHKARDRHDTSARRFERRRAWFGALAIIASATATSSVVASISAQSTPDQGGISGINWAILAAAITVVGGVLAALQTFLDYAGRSSRHHDAGVQYKAIVRELEEILTGKLSDCKELPDIDDLRKRLDGLEASSPVIGGVDWNSVERRYQDIYLVDRAIQLSPERALTPDERRRLEPDQEDGPSPSPSPEHDVAAEKSERPKG
jgi:hypothetical protein